MVSIPKYTEAHRQFLLDSGRDSLFFFAQALLGFEDMLEHPHKEICEALDGRGTWGPDWTRGLITASRGFLKSSIATVAFPLREGLYRPNWSCRILGSSHDNAQVNFFAKMVQILRESPRRNFLCEYLFRDRIPDNFNGWNDSQIVFLRTDPMAPPAITYKGAYSDQEGYHGNLILIDDPEGAETERSEAAQVDAHRVVFSIAPPLLIRPERDRILVVATPHGDNPLVYRILEDKYGRIEQDNTKRLWKKVFIPALNEQNESNWPQRFSTKYLLSLKEPPNDPRLFDQQYMLRKQSLSSSEFDMKAIELGHFRWSIPEEEVMYRVILWDQDLWMKKGELKTSTEFRKCRLEDMDFFLHFDPTHKKDTIISTHSRGKLRPSKAAIVATGVAPDGHKFVFAAWTAKEDLDVQARQLYRMDRLFGARKISVDPIGAQVWFAKYAEALERQQDSEYRSNMTTGQFGPKRRIGPLSRRLVEDKRTVKEAKEQVIVERLRVEIGSCRLHIDPKLENLMEQFRRFGTDLSHCDLLDALAQGPTVWQAPLAHTEEQQKHQRQEKDLKRVLDKYTGYYNPWDMTKPPPDLDEPEGSQVEQVGEVHLGKLFTGKPPKFVVGADEFGRDLTNSG